jgi:CBS domain-containing protein
MKVQELMTTNVSVCGPETNLAEAAGLMWERDCGMLPVVADDGKAIGVITDRDICMALATRNRLASEIRVREVMSGQTHACRATDDVKHALRTMEREQVRRTPVVDDDGKLQGILSISDIVLHAEDGRKRHSELNHEDAVGALKAICADRRPEASRQSPQKSAAVQS